MTQSSKEQPDSTELAEDRTDLAEDRTDLAEDRTLLANERTFSGWARTSFGAIALGVGFTALFQKMEPAWVPKTVTTIFILLGMLLIVLAERRASAMSDRLSSHSVDQLPVMNLRILTIAICIGASGLITGIWMLL